MIHSKETRTANILSASKSIHLEIRDLCISQLKSCKLIRANPKDPASDRNTYVVIANQQKRTANDLSSRYGKWLASFVRSADNFLSSAEVNMLRANEVEIKSYLRMNRRGQDLSVKLFRKIFITELDDLLEQQQSICTLFEESHSRSNFAKLRRYWSSVPLTVGVEEEHQIVSTVNWDLAQDVDSILENNAADDFSREVYKSQIETKTPVCPDIKEVAKSLRELRTRLQACLPASLAVLSAGTHPFSQWNSQSANKTARTELFMHDMQDVVRRLVTFGLHVHVGVGDRELAIKIMNDCRQFLPLLLAISASSPFWEGRLTGLASYRGTVFSALPRTGIPPLFTDYHEFQQYLQTLSQTNSFDSIGSFDPTKVWWDVRLHPEHPTIEFRVCDATTTLKDATCIAAICQAVVAKLAKLQHSGTEVSKPPKYIIEENKWRAIRYGHRARFIDPSSQREVPLRFVCLQLLDFVDDVLSDLKSREEVRHLLTIVGTGCSASDQIKTFTKSSGGVDERFRKVVMRLASQFLV